MVALILLLSFTSHVLNYAWPSEGCCDSYNTSCASSLEQNFTELADYQASIYLSRFSTWEQCQDNWSLWAVLLIFLGAFQGIMPKLHPADRELHFGVDFRDVPITSGVFQVVFESCTNSKVHIFIHILLLWVFAARNLRAVKKHQVKQKGWKQWETSPSLPGTRAGHR